MSKHPAFPPSALRIKRGRWWLVGSLVLTSLLSLPVAWQAFAQADKAKAAAGATKTSDPKNTAKDKLPTAPAKANVAKSTNPAVDATQATKDAPAAATGNVLTDIFDKAGSILSSVGDGSLALKAAVKLLATSGPVPAIAAAKDLPNAADRKVALWVIATSADPKVTAPMIADAIGELKDWPGQALLKLRYELAFLRDAPEPKDVIRVLGLTTAPVSEAGTLALAHAYRVQNRTKDVADVIRPYWRNSRFSVDTEKAILAEFSDVLAKTDNKTRMDRLLYDGHNDEGLRTAKLIDKDTQALAEAWVAVNKRASNAAAKIAAVPASMQKDPAFIFAKAQALRRADKNAEAAEVLLTAPTDPKLLVDPDAWSEERRITARKVADAEDPKTAYQLVSAHAAANKVEKVEAEWESGWYSFRYLNDAKQALVHFKNIGDISSTPLSLARSEYWQGRASETLGDKDASVAHFRKAAQFPTTFYGQLASVKLNMNQLTVSAPPVADAAARKRFEDRELVQGLHRFIELERDDAAGIFYRALADRLTDAGDMALLAEIAEKAGDYQAVLNIGKTAQQRGLGADIMAFPMGAIPKLSKEANIELPVLYAIARQESSFDVGSVSSAGALGLMQLMPGTAKETASAIGIPYEKAKLTSDAGYNATLGAAHLAGLVSEFNGSYALAFAAYNAGKTRVYEWLKTYGDPRDPKVDPIDWIEKIPFTETRNYVQRTLENLQVYRLQTGVTSLKLESDITGRQS